jgi:hypothetical protein
VARYDFFSYTSKDDEYNDYELDGRKGPALEIYGTDLTLLARQPIRRMFSVKQNY